MRKIFILILTLLTFNAIGQNLQEEANKIVTEATLLYKSEMASWHGTDLFMSTNPSKENIGGYLSYLDKNKSICIFFSKDETPVVIGTITFDSTYNLEMANIDLKERPLTKIENDYYQIRKAVMNEMIENPKDFFKFYENTSPNIIPIIKGKEKKAYILTGPRENGVVIFGNDYLISFNEKNKIVNKKVLHQNIIPIESILEEDQKSIGTVHNHLHETGDFITVTDLCTLMLYDQYTNWESHIVVSENYINIWNCKSHNLVIISKSDFEKDNSEND